MPQNAPPPAIELRGLTKQFGDVIANDNISLTLRHGEILCLLGENGSGKTTLMNLLSGLYFPDGGEILVNGVPASIRSPGDAFSYGIGMVHQHYMLVDVFTAAENIALGLGENRKAVAAKVRAIADKYGFALDPDKKIYEMSVSEKQTVEIVKLLYRGAEILILDEPTAVLTPQETERLFAVMRNMKADGKALIIITHKLHEVMAVSDRVSVLRRGKYVGTVETSETSQKALTEMMVGHSVTLNIDRPAPENPSPRLEVRHLTCRDAEGVEKLKDVSFTAMGGEILGIAGVAGSGQRELLEAIAGLYPVASGEIVYHAPEGGTRSLTGLPPMEIRKMGVALAFVPEDRLGMGLAGTMGMTENMSLRSWYRGKGLFLDRREPRHLAEEIREKLEVSTPSVSYPVRRMSGGNAQKVLVGREIASAPTVLMSAYAVRGLDIRTSYAIYSLMTEQKRKGVAVIYVGEDLDALLELCDRILVLCGGEVSGIVDGRTATREEIGLLMTKAPRSVSENETPSTRRHGNEKGRQENDAQEKRRLDREARRDANEKRRQARRDEKEARRAAKRQEKEARRKERYERRGKGAARHG